MDITIQRFSVLALEDDKETQEMLKASISEEGHIVTVAETMAEGARLLERLSPDILIIDRMLPDGDGLQFCAKLKRSSAYRHLPVLLLTGKVEVSDKVLGLKLGADDYLTKPFAMEELKARLEALLRRAGKTLQKQAVLVSGPLSLDTEARTVRLGKGEVSLTNKEFDLLRAFLERPGKVLTREFLLAAVWGITVDLSSDKTVDVTIMHLRKKLGEAGDSIVAVRSQGYKLER